MFRLIKAGVQVLLLLALVCRTGFAQSSTPPTVPVVRGELRNFAAGAGQHYFVELVNDTGRQVAARAGVEGNGSFELRNVAADSYRLRVMNLYNESIAEQWVHIGQGFDSLTISLPQTPGSRPGTGVIAAKRLAIKVPKEARKEFAKAQKASEKHQFERAAAHLRKALEICPNYFEARSNLGVQLIRMERLEEARGELVQALKDGGDDSVALNNLALAQYSLGQLPEAEASARRAMTMDPERPSIRYILALVLLRKSGARPEAIRHLRSTADLYPRARLALAQAYAEEKHIDEAAAELRLYLQNRNAEHRPQVEAMLRSFAQSR